MNNDVRRDFISWMLAFGIIRISIVLIQDVLIWKLLFRLGKLNVDFKKKTIIDSNFINIVEVCNKILDSENHEMELENINNFGKR